MFSFLIVIPFFSEKKHGMFGFSCFTREGEHDFCTFLGKENTNVLLSHRVLLP